MNRRFKPGDICIDVAPNNIRANVIVEVIDYLLHYPEEVAVRILSMNGRDYTSVTYNSSSSECNLELISTYNSPLYKALS